MTLRFSIFSSVLLGLMTAVTGVHAADADKVLIGPPQHNVPGHQSTYAQVGPNLSGFVEGSYRYGSSDSLGFDADGSNWSLRGAINSSINNGFNIQVDGIYSSTEVEGLDSDSIIGSAHAYYRQPDRFAVGGFIEAARLSSSVLDAVSTLGLDDHATDIIGGVEAAYFTDPVTIYGQLGFGQVSYSGFDADHLRARAGARFYATDNIRFDLDGMFNRLSAYGADVDVYTVSAVGNYRLANAPITAYGGYRYNRASLDAAGLSLGSADLHSLVVGARVSFGSTSLKDEERNGAMWVTSDLGL